MAAGWGHLPRFHPQMVLSVHEVLHTESDDHALTLQRDAQHLNKNNRLLTSVAFLQRPLM